MTHYVQMSQQAVVVPGQVLGDVGAVRGGAGTYIRGKHVCASLVGTAVTTPAPTDDSPAQVW